jgi:hypothetical protein
MSLLSSYIDNKLDIEERQLVEKHLLKCNLCYKKYLEMKNIMNNLHYEYAKLQCEFDKIEADKTFNIREYEFFYNNISPYIDDELSYDDSIKFRKYLLKSKQARTELSSAYGLKNNIHNSFEIFKDNVNVNVSKNIIRKIKIENQTPKEIYKRAAAVLFVMISALIVLSFYFGFTYFNKSIATTKITSNEMPFLDFENFDKYIKVTFDDDTWRLVVE